MKYPIYLTFSIHGPEIAKNSNGVPSVGKETRRKCVKNNPGNNKKKNSGRTQTLGINNRPGTVKNCINYVLTV